MKIQVFIRVHKSTAKRVRSKANGNSTTFNQRCAGFSVQRNLDDGFFGGFGFFAQDDRFHDLDQLLNAERFEEQRVLF